MKNEWKLLDRKVLHQAQTSDEISCIVDTVKVGSNQFDYVYVRCPYEVVYVVGINAKNEVAMIEQYRYLLDEVLLEIPAGSPDGNESLVEGAAREFEEETGFKVKELVKLNSFYSSTGITDQKCHVFLAEVGIETEQNLEPGEDIRVRWIPLKMAVSLVESGKVSGVGAAYGIMLAKDKVYS